MKNKIIVYTSNNCGYCVSAKKLLKEKNLSYEELNIQLDTSAYAEMLEKSNGLRTVPQIFINNNHVGGYDDLATIAANGDLNKLLINEQES